MFVVRCLVLRESRRFEEDLIDIAPDPVLARFEGLDDGVVGGMKVLGGVLVFRRVAAADVAADKAEAEVDPAVARLEAILATVRARGDIVDLVEMGAGLVHGGFPSVVTLA
jgi:hypothetical protein